MGMMLADDIALALPELQREAEATFLDTFVAYSPDPNLVPNPETGNEERSYFEEYVTPGKVSGRSREGDTQARTVKVGGVERLVVQGGLHIPYAAPLPVAGEQGTGWEFECVAVGNPINAFRLGRRWLVVEVPLDDATARRLDVVEIPREVAP